VPPPSPLLELHYIAMGVPKRTTFFLHSRVEHSEEGKGATLREIEAEIKVGLGF